MPPDRTPVKQLAVGGKGDQQPKNRFKVCTIAISDDEYSLSWKTKCLNEAQFRSFAQVVKDLRIDVVHKVRKADSGSDPADGASFFCSALNHWTGLNGTADFTRFVKTVRPLAQSLPQILHHQSAIVRLLVEHLQVPETLAYEPLLR
jgi:hypothetical protein